MIVWDAAGMTKEAVLLAHRTRVTGVVFSPDGEWVASVDQDSRLIRWDVARREPRWEATGDGGSAYCLAVSPDGRWLATTHGVYGSAGGRHAVNFYDGSRPGGAITGVYCVSPYT